MSSNLVTAGLLLGMVSLLCLSRGTEGDKGQDVIKDSLVYIKDFAQRKSTSPALAMELGKLDADHVCTADGLAGLRKAVKMIRAKIWGKPKSLTKAIKDYTNQAVKLCFEEADKEWTDEIDRDIRSNYFSLLNLDYRYLKRGSSHRLSLSSGGANYYEILNTGMFLRKTVYHPMERLLVDEYVTKTFLCARGKEKPTKPALSLSEDIERLIIEPCRKFSEDQNTSKIIKPVVDLMLALDRTTEFPRNRLAGWTGRLMICQWFMAVGAKNLALKAYLGVFHSYINP